MLLDVIRVCLVFLKDNRIYKICEVFFSISGREYKFQFFIYPDDLIFLLFLFGEDISVQNEICFKLDGFKHDGYPFSAEIPVTQAGQHCY